MHPKRFNLRVYGFTTRSFKYPSRYLWVSWMLFRKYSPMYTSSEGLLTLKPVTCVAQGLRHDALFIPNFLPRTLCLFCLLLICLPTIFISKPARDKRLGIQLFSGKSWHGCPVTEYLIVSLTSYWRARLSIPMSGSTFVVVIGIWSSVLYCPVLVRFR